MKSDKTIDEAIQEFKKYCELNGDFDELDFKETIFDHALKTALEIIDQHDPQTGKRTGELYWGNQLRKAFRKEYGGEE